MKTTKKIFGILAFTVFIGWSAMVSAQTQAEKNAFDSLNAKLNKLNLALQKKSFELEKIQKTLDSLERNRLVDTSRVKNEGVLPKKN